MLYNYPCVYRSEEVQMSSVWEELLLDLLALAGGWWLAKWLGLGNVGAVIGIGWQGTV